ncbi:MAG: holo-ACP synthase [Nitrosospira sp.]|nr:holo-ACP synthase [Nitrosospira sp.]MDW7642271.1 holo-ACP synthase [Nitrosomonadaceae bacterium]MBI0408055.1 holo-ACP synthase [Nitrosospira sp.]MBI0414028.1 holo-ACP synthase [Nitrosospira sp.]MBI0415386.1 holo-ACP synthase [Nitrosospira sp.]
MIYGIGTDLVELSRIAKILKKYDERFSKKLLTDSEWPEFINSARPARFLAKRFAAKEAFSKAIGTGLRYPVNLNYIGITHDCFGKPYFNFHPELSTFIKDKGIINCHISISDEVDFAYAFVILEQ